eukprot:6425834-Pyramimonas_sp.AAC.1
MWPSPQRCAHPLSKVARHSRLEGGSFSNFGSRFRSRSHSISMFARVSRISMVNVAEHVSWTDSGLCGCNS